MSRTGEVIGGLFFGHSAPNRFSAQHESLIAGVAGQAAVGIDNARLYEEATRARASLSELNRSLEERIAARTAELVASNRELLEEKEQRELVEDQLRQAQKMEALGQLTGGIAHDFNNLLAIIVGSLDVLRRRVDRGQFNDMTRFLNNAMEGAQRATSLTQRLLAYARRQPLAPEVIDPKSLVVDVSELLRRTIPETIRIETVVSAGLWLTHADKSELENAIVNLAVNARDAMPDGGQLTLEASNADIDDRYVSDHPGVSTGQYVLIAVTDTGSGMTKEVAERAFDPFFTTKETGKGTGLGLSQLYGYVRQTGGHVKIYSELGAGTTVKMYLPRYTGAGATSKGTKDRASLPLGTEVVLLVEDEEGVRLASAEALKELGYDVHLAADAAEALRILETVEHVDLLFTDVVMPGMNGRQLADAALLLRPQLKILFTSGYTRNAIVHNGVLDTGVSLLVKPFTLVDLANKLRSVLDAGRKTL